MMGASCLLQSYLETAFNIFSGSYVVESGFAISFNARRHHGFSGVRIQPLRANWKRTDGPFDSCFDTSQTFIVCLLFLLFPMYFDYPLDNKVLW